MGIQANFWSEYVITPEFLEYLMMPRLSAVAEAAWIPRRRAATTPTSATAYAPSSRCSTRPDGITRPTNSSTIPTTSQPSTPTDRNSHRPPHSTHLLKDERRRIEPTVSQGYGISESHAEAHFQCASRGIALRCVHDGRGRSHRGTALLRIRRSQPKFATAHHTGGHCRGGR